VHFGLRRLAIDADQPFDQITRKLIEKMKNPLR
jgi:high-affinity nickel permease